MTDEPSRAEILAALGGVSSGADPAAEAPAKRGRGRPKGSTNKEPKRPRAADFDAAAWVAANCRFICNGRGVVYMATRYNGKMEWHLVMSERSRYAVGKACREATGQYLGASLAETILKQAEGEAQTNGPFREPCIRVGWDGNDVLIDLGTRDFTMARVTKGGFTVEPIGDFPFVRPQGFLALPEPEPEGNINDARAFFCGETEHDFVMCMAWMVGALCPDGPYVFANISGEQGSGKSTVVRMARSVTDPNDIAIRTQPREADDVVVAAYNNHVLAFDNTAKFEDWLSNLFCVVATGGGIVSRKLYTDAAEAGFVGMRPIINSAITQVIAAPDLAQRAFMIKLRRIEENDRSTERRLWQAWMPFRATMLGILCDGVSSALRLRDEVEARNYKLPRMADAAIWAIAAEPGLGLEEGSVLAALHANANMALAEAFESDAVALAIHNLLPDEGQRWSGTMNGLLDALGTLVSEPIRKSNSWPKTPQGLTAKLDRIRPVLRSHGLVFHKARGDVRNLVLERVRHAPEATPPEPEGKSR